jgi:beta-glucanase (GH16 family)
VTPGDLRGKPWVFDHEFFLLLNVAVGGAFSVTPQSSVAFPQMMLNDYIRVYAGGGQVPLRAPWPGLRIQPRIEAGRE